jgi:ferredoxin
MRKARLRVKVDNDRCDRYGICQMEAPKLFELSPDGRLFYQRRPAEEEVEQAAAAARCCPMQAIKVDRT